MRNTRWAAIGAARRKVVGTIVLLLAATPAFSQQTYHTNDVTPPAAPGGKLTGGASGKQVGSGSNGHAYLLNGNALTAIDLTPPGYYSSNATSISSDGSQQCGYGYGITGQNHPLLWSGSNSATDLIPSGYNFGYCTGVDNGQQTGFAENQSYFITASHAYLWNGSSTGVDLHPIGTPYTFSRALGVRGGEQVGYASSQAYAFGEYAGYHTTSHAYRWSNTAASGVDLHPIGFDASEATSTNGIQQGGWGYIALTPGTHALLWSGDAASVVDLHPAGYSDTRVNALTDALQVGDGWVGTPWAAGSVRHALAWSGTAESVIDLNQYLPAGYTHGVATGVDSNGNVVGYAFKTPNPYAGLYPQADAIAVVFAPGQAPAAQLTSVTVDNANAAPGSVITGTATLASAAPVGGVTLTFLSTNLSIAATPASVAIPEGSSSAVFNLAVNGAALTAPSTFRIYATNGTVSKFASITVTPVVNLSTLNVNSVEGGFGTTGTVLLNIPAQTGGATVALTSGDPALLTVPGSVTVPQFASAYSFAATSTAVSTATTVPVTAVFNGQTLTANVTLSPAPVISVASISLPDVVGGQGVMGTVILNNFPRSAAGATVAIVSNDASVQVPPSVFVPQGSVAVNFMATTSVVSAIRTVTLTAAYNGSNASGTVNVNPIPKVTIVSAVYDPTLLLFKVQADTSYANSILTYGVDGGPAIGTLQLELGVWKGSILMMTQPKTVTVWNSNGGSATMNVSLKSSGGGGGGGGTSTGGGGGGTSTAYKISISTTGKGTVTTNPTGTSFAAGTVVTLTATPAAGSPWVGWSGNCSGTATTCTLTMNADMKVTANFK